VQRPSSRQQTREEKEPQGKRKGLDEGNECWLLDVSVVILLFFGFSFPMFVVYSK
jgi:hypothetical protein